MTGALASALHLVAIGVALAAMVLRGAMALEVTDAASRARVTTADNVSGIAAMLMIGAGLWRLFGGLAKPVAWYMANDMFFVKMGMLGLLLLLELIPMAILIQWRVATARHARSGASGDPVLWKPDGRWVAVLSFVEFGIGIGIVFAATCMARGVGMDLFG